MKRRIHVVAPEPIRARMAGMGIRALELARALAPDFDVRLLVPNDASECPDTGVPAVSAPPGSARFASAARECDAALVSGHAANFFLHAAPDVPVAVDWYDPFLVENFRYRETLGATVEENDRRAWRLQLARGDFFLCASPEQRLFYAGMLVVSGRVGAAEFLADPELSRLLAVVPFGVSEPHPGKTGGAVARAIGASEGDPVLHFGGLYEWHDVAPLYAAWPRLLAAHPGIRLLFSQTPNAAVTPQGTYGTAVEEATRRGWKDRSVFFLPWSDYARRHEVYAAATLAVSSCRPGLEAELSFRTRLLDAAAAGLPVVSRHGGPLARELAAAGAAREFSDADAFFGAVAGWLADAPARERASRAAREVARRYRWEAVAAPLRAFFSEPRASRRLPFPDEEPGTRRSLLRRIVG